MSKADQLGNGAAFNRASTSRSSRRQAFDKAIKGEAADGARLDVPVTSISNNPDNLRNHLRNIDSTAESMREVGVIVPIVVGTVDAYLRDRPDRADDLDDGAQYVLIDGHRRLEAARRAGLATIPVHIDNARISTDEALLEAAFIANYHRDDMTDLEEATALKSLVDLYGSQTKAALRLGISQATIATKLSLLKLAPDLQADLLQGRRTVEHVRNLGKLPEEEQRKKADERRRQAEQRAARGRKRPAEQTGTGDYHAVIIPGASAQRAGTPAAAVPASTSEPEAGSAVPEPRAEPEATPAPAQQVAAAVPDSSADAETGDSQPKRLPYDDPLYVVRHLEHKMDSQHFVTGARVWMTLLRERQPGEYRALLDELIQYDQQPT